MIWIFNTYDISNAQQVFNIDESGVSSRTHSCGKGKAAMRSNRGSNAVELKFFSNAEQLTIISVFSADDKRWNHVVILSGTLKKFRVRADGKKRI